MDTQPRRYRVGVDIGGTFTDLVLMDDATGRTVPGKVLTTYPDASRGVEAGLVQLLKDAGAAPADVTTLVHGTTLVTNALIERKGAPTALLTTAGHRDTLEIRRESRYDMYDIFLEMPEPLVPRHRRYGVNERIHADGAVARPLDAEQVKGLIAELQALGVQAVAVSFLHSYKNPAHEREVAALFRELAPEICVSLSAEVQPELREYERTSTTVANVYVRPAAEAYLQRLEQMVAELGIAGRLNVMLSNGGISTVATAGQFPIRLLESGPAAGALAAAFYGRLTGTGNLLSFDMGGTTAKACIVENGEPLVSSDFEVARVYRFKKGSGLPVKVPVIDMIEIGAGGGSIARVDSMGLLKVGPDSATSVPGPACYGRGGTEPTVTDADLVLGYLDPAFFLGGQMSLDPEAAMAAIKARLAERLGIDPVQAAWGIHRVVNENMAAAARVHAVERGKDLRGFTLFGFGGAGPVHAYRVAEILKVDRMMIPLGAGVASAFGFLVAPLAFDFVRTDYARLDEIDWAGVNRLFAEMEAEGRAILAQGGVPAEQITYRRTCDMRYWRQGSEVAVAIPGGQLGPASAPAVQTAFDRVYTALYGRTNPDAPVEALNWRVTVSGPCPEVRLAGTGAAAATGGSLKARRSAYFPELGGYVDTPVHDRYRLIPGDTMAGPAIIEERESTTVIGPRGVVSVDPYLNLVMRWQS